MSYKLTLQRIQAADLANACRVRKLDCYIVISYSLQCRRFLQAHECFCSRKRHVEEEMGRESKGGGGGPFPSLLSFFRPSTYPEDCYLFSPQSSSVIKSKMANIIKRLSPAQNTPTLQATSRTPLLLQLMQFFTIFIIFKNLYCPKFFSHSVSRVPITSKYRHHLSCRNVVCRKRYAGQTKGIKHIVD